MLAPNFFTEAITFHIDGCPRNLYLIGEKSAAISRTQCGIVFMCLALKFALEVTTPHGVRMVTSLLPHLEGVQVDIVASLNRSAHRMAGRGERKRFVSVSVDGVGLSERTG